MHSLTKVFQELFQEIFAFPVGTVHRSWLHREHSSVSPVSNYILHWHSSVLHPVPALQDAAGEWWHIRVLVGGSQISTLPGQAEGSAAVFSGLQGFREEMMRIVSAGPCQGPAGLL